jgi:hypothetical protein
MALWARVDYVFRVVLRAGFASFCEVLAESGYRGACTASFATDVGPGTERNGPNGLLAPPARRAVLAPLG